MVSSYTRSTTLGAFTLVRYPLFHAVVWSFPTYDSEARQVLPDLPGRDLLVVPVPLVPLHPDEVVHVVLVPALAERLPDHVVALELVRRVQEVGGQRLEPPRTQLVVRNRVEILRVRLPGIDPVLDPVDARREDHRGRQI